MLLSRLLRCALAFTQFLYGKAKLFFGHAAVVEDIRNFRLYLQQCQKYHFHRHILVACFLRFAYCSFKHLIGFARKIGLGITNFWQCRQLSIELLLHKVLRYAKFLEYELDKRIALLQYRFGYGGRLNSLIATSPGNINCLLYYLL